MLWTQHRNVAILISGAESNLDGFAIEYVELPGGRRPAREFIDSLDDEAAARVDAFSLTASSGSSSSTSRDG